MNNLTTAIKYKINVNEKDASENIKMFNFCSQYMIEHFDSNANGFVLFDYEVFKTPHQLLIYNLIKSATDKHNIDLDNYHIIIRPSIERGRTYYDMCIGYGEYHNIITPEGNIINDCGNFQMDLFFNELDDIINIGTNLTKKNTENEPIINKLVLFRPQLFSAFINNHSGTYYFKQLNNITEHNFSLGLVKFGIDFIDKSNGIVNYPKFSEIFQNEDSLHDYYYKYYNFEVNNDLFINNVLNTKLDSVEVIADIIELNIHSCSTNTDLKNILEKYNYTFEKLYRSMYPGVYNEPDNEIIHYKMDEGTGVVVEDINLVFNHKCIGFQTMTENTRKIISEIHDYMKNNGLYNIVITV
jgi:hypothetical protein